MVRADLLKKEIIMDKIKVSVTDEDRNFYKENGYWISPKLIDNDRIGHKKGNCLTTNTSLN
jgi:hypothetical protein